MNYKRKFIKTGTQLIKHFPVSAVKTPLQTGNTVLGPVLHGFHHVLHALNDRLVHRGQKHTVVVVNDRLVHRGQKHTVVVG